MGDRHTKSPLTSPRTWIKDSLAPLKEQAFRLLWIGRSVSSAGDSVVEIALVFGILHIGGNAADIGFVIAIQLTARLVFTLAGGVWADRMRRQYVTVASDLVRGTVDSVLAVLFFTGRAQVWQIAIGAGIMGAGGAFFGPAFTGLLPETVPPEKLQVSNALISFSDSFFNVVGPAVAGVIIAVFGPALLFAADALSYLVSAISLGRLRLASRNIPERTSFRAELTVGWREITARSWYWINLIAHSLWNFAFPAYFVLGPVIAAQMLGGPKAWGVIAAAWAAGAVVGSIIAMHAKPSRPLVAANLALMLTALPVLALAVPLATWVIAAAAVLAGIGLSILMTMWAAAMQQLIPDEVRSRVDSYDWLLSLSARPVGYAIIGVVAAEVGNRATMIGAAFLLAVPCTLVVFVPAIRAVRRTPQGTIVGPPPRTPGRASLDHA